MNRMRWLWGLGLLLGFISAVTVYYRVAYNHSKRLRVVVPGVLYRSGQLSRSGLEEAIQRYGIRTVINLRDEEPDPKLDGIRQSRLCQELGAKYIHIQVDMPRLELLQKGETPQAMAKFLRIMRDPRNHPVLLHCQAGLHRTGVLTAVYRMELQGWTVSEAKHELRENGYGDWRCNVSSPAFRSYVHFYPLIAGKSKVDLLRHRHEPTP